ncbi:unnamed protein product [Cochlearia groenlandica]
MSKNLSMVLMMIMMIIGLFVTGGEAKSEIECSIICRPHCQRSSPASECTDCHRKCNLSPPSIKTKIKKHLY